MERQEKDLQSILGQILKREGRGVGGSTAGTGSPRPVVIGRHVDHSHRPLIDNLTTSQRSVHSVSSITGRARTQIYASVCQCFFSLSRSLSRSACIFRSSRVLRLLICQFPRSAQTARLYVIEVGLWLVLVLGGAFGVDLANLLEGAG